MIVSLNGFMGCGKSTAGKELAKLVPSTLVDLDAYIEWKEGRTIPEIFAEDGEEAFRKMEEVHLAEILSSWKGREELLILSLGGGTLTTPLCREMVMRDTVSIYLRASVGTLLENLAISGTEGRPMLRGEESLRDKIEALMEKRESIYEDNAHLILDIDGKTYNSVAEEIVSFLSGAEENKNE